MPYSDGYTERSRGHTNPARLHAGHTPSHSRHKPASSSATRMSHQVTPTAQSNDRVTETPTGLPTVDDALALGLTRAEYELVCQKQTRPPNQVELAMYSLLWSEHCAYKHSKKLLRTLPTEGEHVVIGPGENAGAVDVGDGLVCAFKVESHNHPSAVEPFQGAATGVGGILRDIFAIGARPIAVLDSLRFGEPLPVDGSAPVPGG